MIMTAPASSERASAAQSALCADDRRLLMIGPGSSRAEAIELRTATPEFAQRAPPPSGQSTARVSLRWTLERTVPTPGQATYRYERRNYFRTDRLLASFRRAEPFRPRRDWLPGSPRRRSLPMSAAGHRPTSGHGPQTAEFVPPHHENVPAAIDDLVTFMRRDDISPLAHAAIAHAQFETAHPFVDGNGRTGRALVHSLLRAKGLTTKFIVPVSAGRLADTDGYLAALGAYRSGDVAPIVEQFSDASYRAVVNGRQLVADLGPSVRTGRAESTRGRKRSCGECYVLMRQPVESAALLQQELSVSFPGATAASHRLRRR